MPIQPKFTVSGYRGVWNDTLTPEIAQKYTRAFVRFIREDEKKENPTILIGRDGRETGPEIRKVILEELKNLGVNTVDGDILPTPTVLFSVKKHGYDGGIIITASHNPIEYNGLKFVNNKGLFLEEVVADKINEYCAEDIGGRDVVYGSLGSRDGDGQRKFSAENFRADRDNISAAVPNFLKEHADQIVANVDVELIKSKKFKIAVDMINASACVMDSYFFEQLGVEVIPFNNIPNGKFGHKPEPNTENLTDIAKFVKESKTELGFAHDPDADRLVMINELGEVVFEEYTIVTAVENVLSKNPGQPIVINLSTSRMSIDVAKKYGSECFLAKVGEPNVVREIISHNAIIGGEGNGGVIFPAVNLARDSFMGIALILELLAKRNQTVSQCISAFPKYFMKKGKWSLEGKNLKDIILKMKNQFKEAKTIEIDGIRLDFSSGAWLHLHPSNTEPIFRLYGEAKTETEIEALFKQAELTFS
jgi:phosphomannomutase